MNPVRMSNLNTRKIRGTIHWTKILVWISKISNCQMKQKVIPSNSDISEVSVNFSKLTKTSEMNVPEKTVPFDSRPKRSGFFRKWIAPKTTHDQLYLEFTCDKFRGKIEWCSWTLSVRWRGLGRKCLWNRYDCVKGFRSGRIWELKISWTRWRLFASERCL